MELPHQSDLPIGKLSSCFRSVTNTYKFYWFLAIIDTIQKEQKRIITFNELTAKMIASAWYPILYFNIQFSRRDSLAVVTKDIQDLTKLRNDSAEQEIINTLNRVRDYNCNTELIDKVNELGRFVPFRFLGQWFAYELRGVKDFRKNSLIEQYSNEAFSQKENIPLYRIVTGGDPYIEIHPDWFNYVFNNGNILRDFCLWNLAQYLNRRNPNVPNIMDKLFVVQNRNLNKAHKYWDAVLKDNEMQCIYSRKSIDKTNYTIDHFIPWRFTAHDLLWNLIPVPKEINSSKGDSLPDMDEYFNDFCETHLSAFRLNYKSANSKILEDFTMLFNQSAREINSMEFQNFRNRLDNVISPLMKIAANQGFAGNWRFGKRGICPSTFELFW